MIDEVMLVVPPLLRPLVGDSAELVLEVGQGASLRELLDAIDLEFPVFARRVRDETGALRRYVNIYLDGEDVRRGTGLETRVTAGQEIIIIQSVAGG